MTYPVNKLGPAPRPLTREEFDQAQVEWIDSAPDGLDEASFTAGFDDFLKRKEFEAASNSQADAELLAGVGTISGLGLESGADRAVETIQASRLGPVGIEQDIVNRAPQVPGALPAGPTAKAPRGYPKPPHQQPEGVLDLVEAATMGTFGPEAQSRARWALAPAAARAAGPIVGGAIGTGLLPGAGTIAGGGIGSAAGELVAQGIQNLPESVTGIPQQRQGIAPEAVVGAGIIGGVPAAPLARAGMVGKVLGRAAEAAALNQASDTLIRYADDQPLMPTAEELQFNLGLGALFGGTFGAVEGAAQRLGRVGQASTAPPGTPPPADTPSATPQWQAADDIPTDAQRVAPGALARDTSGFQPFQGEVNGEPVTGVRIDDYHVSGRPRKVTFRTADGATATFTETADGWVPYTPEPTSAAQAAPEGAAPVGDPSPAASAAPQDAPSPSPQGWTPEAGKARLEALMATQGSFAGAAGGYAAGDDEEDNRLLYAVLGGAVGGAVGAGAGAALGRKPTALDQWRAGMLAQHPAVEVRMTPNSMPRKIASGLVESARLIKEEWGKANIPDYVLKKAGGFDAAIARKARFRNDRIAIPHNSRKLLDTVLLHLGKQADQYDLFNDIVRLRRDMEVYRQNPQTALETGMDPIQAASYLRAAEAKAAADHPGVLQAVDAHHDLMHQIGQVLTQWGKLDPVVAAANPHYLSDYVLAHLRPKSAIGPSSFQSRMNLGYLKRRLGGERETLRDYISVVFRYLNETQQDVQRDIMIRDLATTYDPRTNGTLPNPGRRPPQGYSVMTWPPNAPQGSQKEYWFPTVLRDDLVAEMTNAPAWLQAWQRKINAPQKSLILRAAGGSYLLNNFLGDNINVFADAEKMWKLPRQFNDARRAAWLYHFRDVDPNTLSPTDRQLYDMAALGDRLNIGGAGAAAEIEEQVLRDPLLRRLRENKTGSPLSKARDAVMDIGTDAVALYETWRSFQENWPRMTLFLNQIEAGHAPEKAAVVARMAAGDYADRTPFQARWMSGFFAPFFQWTNKMLNNWVPMYEGPGAPLERFTRDFSRAMKLKGPLGRMLKLAPMTLLPIAWNNLLFPEAEASLEDWEREQFHLLIPWFADEDGRVNLIYFGFSTPANAIGRAFGVGGAYARALDATKAYVQDGRGVGEIAGEQLERSRNQVQMFWGGMASPALKTAGMLGQAALTGNATDIRTGREIFREGMDTSEKVRELAKATLGGVPPFSTALAAGTEGGTPDEDLGAFMKRLLAGSFVKKVDVQERKVFQLARALAQGKQDGQAAMDRFVKETLVTPMVENLRGQDPNMGLKAYMALGNSQAMARQRSALAAATQELARENREWRETAKIVQFMQNHPAWYEKPFIFKRLFDQLEDPSGFEQWLKDEAAAKAGQGQ